MCLIIASQEGAMPEDGVLRHAYKQNDDGWGVASFDGTTVQIEKGFHADSMVKACRRAAGKPFVVHFRYATHGTIDRTNTHPFKVADKVWMAHNGIITIDTPDKTKSDTWHFAKMVSELLEESPEWYGTDDFMKELSQYIGWGNKLSFIGADGIIRIVNEEMGTTIGGAWYSNEYSLPDSLVMKGKYTPDYYDDFMWGWDARSRVSKHAKRTKALVDFTPEKDRWDTSTIYADLVTELKKRAATGCQVSIEELEEMGIDVSRFTPKDDVEGLDELLKSYALEEQARNSRLADVPWGALYASNAS